MHPWPSADAPKELRPPGLGVPGERRRSARIPLRMAVVVYDAYGYVGLFWTDDVSKEGLFLHADVTDRLKSTILRLRFDQDGASLLLRGTAVREDPGQGVGVQLAFWRRGDEAAHAAYRELIERSGRSDIANAVTPWRVASTAALS